MQNFSRLRLMISAAAILTASGAAAADKVSSGQSNQVEEIVVTARKQSESLIKVPVAVTAISATQLDRTATSSLGQIGALAPQVNLSRGTSGTGASFNIRGIGSPVVDAGIEQTVSINIDGTPISRGKIAIMGQFDIGQVEILKGPQALFFGKNSPAGAVSITSVNPTGEYGGFAKAGYETVAREKFVEAAVNVPVTDKLALRLAGRFSKMDGWVTNIAPGGPFLRDPGVNYPAVLTRVPNNKDTGGRVTAVWKPMDKLNVTAKLLVATTSDNDGGQGFQPICPGAHPTDFGLTDTLNDCKLNGTVSNAAPPLAFDNSFRFGGMHQPYEHAKTTVGSINANYDFDALGTLTSLTSYYRLDTAQSRFASDLTQYGVVWGQDAERTKDFSQEFRFASALSGPLNFTAGAFYEYGTRYSGNDAMSSYVNNIVVTSVVNGQVMYDTFQRDANNKFSTYSAFGQLRWNIRDNIELAGGARWTHERRSAVLVDVFVQPAFAAAFRPVGVPLLGKFSGDNVSPEATLSWHPTSESTIYAAYKTGYKSGTVSNSSNLPNSLNSQNIVLAPEKAKGGEIGFKSDLLDRTLRVEATIYDYKFSNLQVSSYNATTISFITLNATSARTKGAEVSSEWRPIEGLTLNGAIAYNQAKYLIWRTSGCYGFQTVAQGCVNAQQDLSGRTLPRAPDWVGVFKADYEMPLGGDLVLGLSGDVKYTSSYLGNDNLNPASRQAGFWIIGAGVRVSSTTKGWELAFIGRDLNNKYYITTSNDKTGGAAGEISAVPNRPRELVLQASYKF